MLHPVKQAWRQLSGRTYQSHYRIPAVTNFFVPQETITLNTSPDPKTMLPPVKFHLEKRIEEIRHELKPPVNNKLISEDFLKIMVVGGPNQRNDYHIEMGEELFYQIKGSIHLDIIHPLTKQPTRIQINEGEAFLLPRGIPHSPQRYENTVGLVVERERSLHEIDCMRWYQPKTGISMTTDSTNPKVWYEEYFNCANLGEQLKPVIHRFQQFKAKQDQQESIPVNPPYFTPLSSPPRPLSYFSNQDQMIGQRPSIQRLNDLPFSQTIQAQSLQVINVAEAIRQHCGSPRLTPFKLFNSEFVFEILTASSATTTVDSFGGRVKRLSFRLPKNCSSKEFLFLQYRGNSQVKKIVSSATSSFSSSPSSLKSSSSSSSMISLVEGELMLIQDRESNLEQLEFDFDSSDGIVWCIYNTAHLD